MVAPDALQSRLTQIGAELARRDGTLALLGLGSAGRHTHRLDEYSDLDFFVIVEAGRKACFVDRLDWLEAIAPLAYSFRNTPDGHKALYDDGIFLEFAVFEPVELVSIPFERGRVIWSRNGFDVGGLEPSDREPEFGAGDEEFLLGELLTNLYVGLGRYARGEKLSGFLFVQNYAVARLIALLELWGEGSGNSRDEFAAERRFEQRFASGRAVAQAMTPGYDRTPAAAAAMLELVSERCDLNQRLAGEVRRLIEQCTVADLRRR